MKYFSLDLETTGLDYTQDQVLSIAAVYDDLENLRPIEDLPYFHVKILRERVVGTPYALALNSDIIEDISNHLSEKGYAAKNIEPPIPEQFDGIMASGQAVWTFFDWIRSIMFREQDEFKEFYDFIHNGIPSDLYSKTSKIIMAGKNFGSFDKQFLTRDRNTDDALVRNWTTHIRMHHRSIDVGSMFLFREDTEPPGLEECKRRAGFADTEVHHDAHKDALDVVRLVRYHTELLDFIRHHRKF